MLSKCAKAFSAGAAGGLMNALALWMMGRYGITELMRLDAHPILGAAYLYPKIVWGGIWGGLLILPISSSRWIARGLTFALLPTLAAFLIVFPAKGKGLFGLETGLMMPVLALSLNFVWGLTASLFYKVAH